MGLWAGLILLSKSESNFQEGGCLSLEAQRERDKKRDKYKKDENREREKENNYKKEENRKKRQK